MERIASGLIDRSRSIGIYGFTRDEQLKTRPVGGNREAGLVFIFLLGDGDGSIGSGLNIDGQDVAEDGECDRFVLKVEAFQDFRDPQDAFVIDRSIGHGRFLAEWHLGGSITA
jgi:hypothetical protein